MRLRSRAARWLPAAAALFAFGSSAEEAWPELAACRRIAEDGARAACYDRAYDARVAAPLVAEAAGRFGYGDVREREERAAERRGERIRELAATVTEVRRRPDRTHVLTLDNGQVWAERGVDYGFRVAVGDRVRIEAAALGSYLLITTGNRSTRVTRLR